MQKQIVLVTGAGTGIGKLSAQSLAEAGHVVYASMRDIAGRNSDRAADVRSFAAARGLQLTQGTDHFPSAGKPADAATAAAYARYDGVMDQIGERLSALTPDDADPKAVADEIVRIVGLPAGARPMRAVIDFVGDGAKEVFEVSERVRMDFARRIGMGDLLEAKIRR